LRAFAELWRCRRSRVWRLFILRLLPLGRDVSMAEGMQRVDGVGEGVRVQLGAYHVKLGECCGRSGPQLPSGRWMVGSLLLLRAALHLRDCFRVSLVLFLTAKRQFRHYVVERGGGRRRCCGGGSTLTVRHSLVVDIGQGQRVTSADCWLQPMKQPFD
jgi:hypothetical protein